MQTARKAHDEYAKFGCVNKHQACSLPGLLTAYHILWWWSDANSQSLNRCIVRLHNWHVKQQQKQVSEWEKSEETVDYNLFPGLYSNIGH